MGRNKQSRIRENQFITVQGWMRNIPQITNNNELLAYALIYGFSQVDGQYLTCKQEYIAQWLGINRYNCSKLLSRMEQKKLIAKVVDKAKGSVKQYKYYCILPQGNGCSFDNRKR